MLLLYFSTLLFILLKELVVPTLQSYINMSMQFFGTQFKILHIFKIFKVLKISKLYKTANIFSLQFM